MHTLELTIGGHFPDNTMVDWVIHRASILDLSGGITYDDKSRIELVASGDQVLVEALEVACSLGPINAQVDSITNRQLPTPDSAYRQQRQFIRYSASSQPKQANNN